MKKNKIKLLTRQHCIVEKKHIEEFIDKPKIINSDGSELYVWKLNNPKLFINKIYFPKTLGPIRWFNPRISKLSKQCIKTGQNNQNRNIQKILNRKNQSFKTIHFKQNLKQQIIINKKKIIKINKLISTNQSILKNKNKNLNQKTKYEDGYWRNHNIIRSIQRDKLKKQKLNKLQTPFSINDWNIKLWNSQSIPSSDEIRDANQDPINATYRFIMMGGHPQDSRKKPKQLFKPANNEELLNEWKFKMDNDLKICICAICGIRDYIDEFSEIKVNSNYLSLFEVDENKLKHFSTAKINAMHICEINDVKYHLYNKGIKNDKIQICNLCFRALKYANKVCKAPINSFKYYDIGKIPNELMGLSIAEKIAISRAILFVPIIHLKCIKGGQNAGIKGHVIGWKTSKNEVLESVVNNLPRTDIDKRIQLLVHGIENSWKVANHIIGTKTLILNINKILKWLKWLKEIGNPDYIDIKTPQSIKEINDINKHLQQCISNILNAASFTNSKIVDDLANQARINIQDNTENFDNNIEGEFLRSIYIAEENNIIKPMDGVLKTLREQIKNVNIIDEFSNNTTKKILENSDHHVNDLNNNIDNDNNNNNNIYNEDNDLQEYEEDIIYDDETILNEAVQNYINLQNELDKNKLNKLNESVIDNDIINASYNIDNKLYNEYLENHILLSRAFPYIFPFGLSKTIGTATIAQRVRKTWCLFYDQRIAKEHDLLFLIFDQIKRHTVNRNVNFRINKDEKHKELLFKLLNETRLPDDIKNLKDNPNSDQAKLIKNVLNPLITITGRTIPWSVQERADSLGKLYSMFHFFNNASHFITISPLMRNNVLALRIAIYDDNNINSELNGDLFNNLKKNNANTYKISDDNRNNINNNISSNNDNKKNEYNNNQYNNDNTKNIRFMDVYVRSHLIINNPVASVHVFYKIINKFFEIIVKLPLNYYSSKNIKTNRLFNENSDKYNGAYGFIKAVYAIIEEQASGNLHLHGLLFGAWDIDILQRFLHDVLISKELCELIDAHITATIYDKHKKPEWIQKTCPNFGLQSYPTNASLIDERASEIASKYNHHKHTPTCWKKNYKTCRFGMPQPQCQKTRIIEIEENHNIDTDNQSSFIIKDKISKPPIRQNDGNPFKNKDDRVIVCNLQRRDEFEQMQVEQNPITTVTQKCNTSMQALFTPSNNKNAMYYISNYFSKNPYEMNRILALFEQAKIEMWKYESQATDAGTTERESKYLLEKLLNKSNILEVSDQQAVASVLGYKSYLCSHRFCFVPIWDAVRFYNKKYHNKHDTDIKIEYEKLYFCPITGIAMGITKFHQYLDRGEELEGLNLYCYCAIINIKPKTQDSNTINIESAKARVNNRIMKFTENSIFKNLIQSIKSCPTVPRISGCQPPEYPGDKPTIKNEINIWETQAKTFVVFYSLLFLPLDNNMLPFDPTQPDIHILPWDINYSWTNFWLIFGSWDIKESKSKNNHIFKRRIWRIFKNMVNNLRSSNKERKFINEFRSQCADIKSHEIGDEKFDFIHNKLNKNKNYDNDLSKISEQIIAQFGTSSFSQNNQNSLRKANIYLDQQINKLQLIDNVSTRRYPKETFKKFKMKNIEKMIKKLKNKKSKQIGNIWKISSKNKKNDIKLKDFQLKAIETLRIYKNTQSNNKNIKSNQLLAFLQGNPGSGKSYTALAMPKELGIRIKFTGTTHTAAKVLEGETINSVLQLGMNLSNFSNAKIKIEKQNHIQNKCNNIDCIVIDEVSMLTPVTLAQIDKHLKESYPNRKQYVFAGFDIILIGDMWQFEPVQPGINKPALYHAAVKYSQQSNRAYNINYQRGAWLFTLFKLVKLEGQVRANKPYNQWLSQLRNPNISQPITDNWLSKIKPLQEKDMKNRTTDWLFTEIIVTGNRERRRILQHKSILFGIKHKQPILKWFCKVNKSGKKRVYTDLNFNPEGIYDELVEYFIRGAPCYLSTSIYGITKETQGRYVDLIWENDDYNIDDFPINIVTKVPQPKYIIIEVVNIITKANNHKKKEKLFIPVKQYTEKLKDVTGQNKNWYYRKHYCDLGFSRTYHKTQGKTMNSIVLSINSKNAKSKKIKSLSLTSLYVGFSRVHNHSEHRVLPYTNEDLNKLKQLKHDPLLLIFFKNYDKNGNWKKDGLLHFKKTEDKKTKIQLGLIKFDGLTVTECKEFVKKFDIIVETNRNSPNLQDYLNTLKPYHIAGKQFLTENNNALWLQKINTFKKQLNNENINMLPGKMLKFYAKRLNIANTKRMSPDNLKKILHFVKKKDTDILSLNDKKINDIIQFIPTLHTKNNNVTVIKQKEIINNINSDVHRCVVIDHFDCITKNCNIHNIYPRQLNYDIKTQPTRFTRNYNICWFIAGCQLLSVITWPASFEEFCINHPNNNLSIIFDIILKARSEITLRSFNSSVAANLFIQLFKTGLRDNINIHQHQRSESDWTIHQEQDSGEFIRVLLAHIDYHERQRKGLITMDLSTWQNYHYDIIDFISNEISIKIQSQILCLDCNNKYILDEHPIVEIMPEMFLISKDSDKKRSVQDLFNGYWEFKEFSDFPCKICNKKNKLKKGYVIKQIGRYLLFNINRYIDNSRKIFEYININDTLLITFNQQKLLYKLKSTVNHYGDSLISGHFTATKYIKNTLFECNDDKFSNNATFKEDKVCVLLYERCDN